MQLFAGRIPDALWPIMHVLPPPNVVTRQEGYILFTFAAASSATEAKEAKAPHSAGVNCCLAAGTRPLQKLK
jgi:hypothetical protein